MENDFNAGYSAECTFRRKVEANMTVNEFAHAVQTIYQGWKEQGVSYANISLPEMFEDRHVEEAVKIMNIKYDANVVQAIKILMIPLESSKTTDSLKPK
ncbi:hypothetical protein U1Q18_052267 [Sarracenia purpurea var. burkii]